MLRGLEIPVVPGPGGRARMIDDESEQLGKIIALSLSDCDSINPFIDLGISEENVFDMNDESTRARVMEYIERRFDRFRREGRAQLKSVKPSSERNEHGESVLNITYIDLKTRAPKDLRLGLGRLGTARILEG